MAEDTWEERFAEWMRTRHWSEDTVTLYGTGLRQFLAYLAGLGIGQMTGLTRELVEGFRTHLFYQRHQGTGQPLSVATQAARLGAVKAFLRFLAQAGYLVVDLGATLELPRVPRPLPTVLSEDQVLRLVEAPDLDTPTGVRDRAILELLYGTGLRNGELGKLRLPELDWERSLVVVREGKGKKSRVVPVGDEALAWLEEYLLRVRPQWVSSPREEHVFLTRRGQPMARGTVVTLVTRWAKTAGLPGVTPHTLRHSCATHMLARGAGLRYLQTLLGHSSSITTEHYTRVELTDLRKVLARCHPRERRSRS